MDRSGSGRAFPADYDLDPARFDANVRAHEAFAMASDVHPIVADQLAEVGAVRVLDLGGGTGRLAGLLPERGIWAVVLDRAQHVRQAPPPQVLGDATQLPFQAGCFDAVAALYVLYHLDQPLRALHEARRVLRPGGTFVACTSGRTNEPELASVLPGWGRPTSFDAEQAARIVGQVFHVTQVVSWDQPYVLLPDAAAVARYLRGRGLTEREAGRRAAGVTTPVRVTKRGMLVWARTRT
jgi:SAM-dependent methyltransferase